MRGLLLSLLLLIPSTAWAWEDWDPETRKMFFASQLAITADWATTRNAADQGWPGVRETNPILGDYPSTSEVDVYMIGLLVTNYFITDWLPEEYRNFYLGVRIFTAGGAAYNNAQLGFGIKF